MDRQTNVPTALGHLRVLDLSRILAGPWAAQVLGDLGAEVIKVENPRGGDDTRRWGPPFVPGEGQGDAAYFTAANRNKSSVGIDFSKPEGADLVRRLAAESDIVIENFKLGGLAKYSLDYPSLRQVNPRLIYCSITGFGQDGPYAHRAGYDFLIQGMGGLMSITGRSDDKPGGGPVKVGVAVSDLFTGMYAATSILAAVAHRERTGEGQHIDCSLFDAQAAMLANQAANWLVGGMTPGRMGNSHPNVVPYRVYPVRDGHVIIAVGNDGQFARLCQVLGEAGLAGDPRFTGNVERVRNRDALEPILEAHLQSWSRDDIIAALEAAGVPCGPINDVSEVFSDPHALAHDLTVEQARPDGTPVRSVAYPARLGVTPATYRRAPPTLGADTDRVLMALLQVDADELLRLRADGVIG